MEVIDNVIRAYEAVKLNDVSKGIIALCTFVAVIIVIQKFVTAWKEAFSEGEKPADMKHFFRLFYIYIYVFAVIIVNKNDLNAVFSKYYNDKAYFDAAQNGAVYKCELESVDKISGDNEPYQVEFTSVLTVYGVSGQKVKFLIRTKGELVRTTPQYPENVTGFFFTQFLQQLVRIEQQNKE